MIRSLVSGREGELLMQYLLQGRPKKAFLEKKRDFIDLEKRLTGYQGRCRMMGLEAFR